MVRHTDADRVPALLVRRARRGRRRLAPLQAAGQTGQVGREPARAAANATIPYADAAQGRRPPSTSMGLHTLHGSVLPSPVIVKLTTARGRSTTNQTARAGAATG
jgi:hypothetical protein